MRKQFYYLLIYSCILFQGCTSLLWEINGKQKPKQYLSDEFVKQERDSFQMRGKAAPGSHPKPVNNSSRKKHQSTRSGYNSLFSDSLLSDPLTIKNIGIVAPAKDLKAQAPVKSQSQIIENANKKAMILPDEGSFHNAVVKYRFEKGATYAIYTAVGRVTKIEFQKGDNIQKVVGGDSVNWLIENCVVRGTPHLFIKPTYPGLETNLSILTEKYTYYLYLKSWKKTFVVGFEWYYPKEDKKKYKEYLEQKKRHSGINDLEINYRIKSKCNDCIEPESLYVDYDTGKMYVKMPDRIRHYSLPVLFSLDAQEKPIVINYRFLADELSFAIDGLYPVLMLRYEGEKGREIFIKEVGFKKRKKVRNFFPALFGF
jgi:type IV secretion system protein TrbG